MKKKKDVRPFVDVGTRDKIYRLSYITGVSVLKMCEDLCVNAFNKGVINDLSPYFKRDIQIDGVNYKGSRNADKFEYQSKNIERVTLQLEEDMYEYAYDLSWAMRTSLSKVIGYAIEKSMSDYEILNQYVSDVLIKKVKQNEKEEFLRLVNKAHEISNENEYGEASLLLHIANEYGSIEEGVSGVLEIAKS